MIRRNGRRRYLRRFFIALGGVLLLAGWSQAGEGARPTAADELAEQLTGRFTITQTSRDAAGRIRFELGDNSVLLYAPNGWIIRRSMATGREMDFERGLPAKVILPDNSILYTCNYTWDSQGIIRQSVRQEAAANTTQYYNSRGEKQLEIRETTLGRCYRTHFSWNANHETFSFFETRSWERRTDYKVVSARTGLVLEHWQIAPELRQVWDEWYALFLGLLQERFQKEYTDRKNLREDSVEKTRGDVLLPILELEKVITPEMFAQAMEKRQVVFSDEWQYIECTEITLLLPAVELIEQPKEITKARQEGDSFFRWEAARKKWLAYPFNPKDEEVIPLNMRGDVSIEWRDPRFLWQAIPNKFNPVFFCSRLIVPEEKLEQERLRVGDLPSPRVDAYDLYALLQAGHTRPLVVYTPVAVGEPLAPLSAREWERVQQEIVFRIKHDILSNPFFSQRDSEQRTQAEVMVHAITPERLLPVLTLAGQADCFRQVTHQPLRQLIFQKLQVVMPRIVKRKMYQYLKPAMVEKGVLKIWQKDDDHPRQGYWIPYSLRPPRDELIRSKGETVIRMDDGRFQWELDQTWERKSVSGRVCLAMPPAAAQTVAVPGIDRAKKNRQPESRPAWFPLLAVIGKGRSGEQVLSEAPGAAGETIFIVRQLDWWGRTQGYLRKVRRNQRWEQIAFFNQQQQLIALQNPLTRERYEFKQSSATRWEAKLRREQQVYSMVFQEGRLITLGLPNGQQLEYHYANQAVQVRLCRRDGSWIYEQQYAGAAGEPVAMRFCQGESITYTRQTSDQTWIMHISDRNGKNAELLVNSVFQILRQQGDGKIIFFARKYLELILPRCFKPLIIDFQLRADVLKKRK